MSCAAAGDTNVTSSAPAGHKIAPRRAKAAQARTPLAAGALHGSAVSRCALPSSNARITTATPEPRIFDYDYAQRPPFEVRRASSHDVGCQIKPERKFP